MQAELGSGLNITWKYCSLEQINSKQGPEWKVWEQGPEHESRGLPAFMAAEAARRQGEDAFERMHFALLEARHQKRQFFTDEATLLEAAQEAELDVERFKADLAEGRAALLAKLAHDHTEATEEHQAFGVPTFVFPNGEAAYLKLLPAPDKKDALRVFENLMATMEGTPNVYELKRPGEHHPKR